MAVSFEMRWRIGHPKYMLTTQEKFKIIMTHGLLRILLYTPIIYAGLLAISVTVAAIRL